MDDSISCSQCKQYLCHLLDIFGFIKEVIRASGQVNLAVLRKGEGGQDEGDPVGGSGFEILEHGQPSASWHADVDNGHLRVQPADFRDGLHCIPGFSNNLNRICFFERFL